MKKGKANLLLPKGFLPKDEYVNLRIHKSTLGLLNEVKKVTGLSMGKIVSDYIKILGTWVSPFSQASLVWDDSDTLINSSEIKVVLKIYGSKRIQVGTKSEVE